MLLLYVISAHTGFLTTTHLVAGFLYIQIRQHKYVYTDKIWYLSLGKGRSYDMVLWSEFGFESSLTETNILHREME